MMMVVMVVAAPNSYPAHTGNADEGTVMVVVMLAPIVVMMVVTIITRNLHALGARRAQLGIVGDQRLCGVGDGRQEIGIGMRCQSVI